MSYQTIRHFACFVNSTYNYVADPSFLCLFTFLPIFLIIAVLIKIDSPGPMIFRQKRCGKDGKEFKMYKFRTMVKDAEKLHDEVLGKNILDGPMFKMKRDPRITNV